MLPASVGGSIAFRYTYSVKYRVFHRRFEAYHHPDDQQGVMSGPTSAATWDNRAEAEAVAEALNERDRDPEYGQLGEDDWVVIDEP